MSFSYNNTHITASGTDVVSFVRFTIDDTDSEAYEVDDEVISALYADTPTGVMQASRNYQTAVAVAEYLYRKYSKMASFSSAGTSVQYGERAKAWLSIVNTLRAKLLSIDGVGIVLYPSRPTSYTEY